jgi:hypothetical protein
MIAGARWTGPAQSTDSVHEFSLGKQFPENPISDILHLSPSIFPKFTRNPQFSSQTPEFEKYLEKGP